MKKSLYTLLSLLFFIPAFFVFSASEVYVYPVAVNKTSYGVGETIKGQFTIHNVKGERQSDVLYSVAVTQGEDPYSVTIGEIKSEEKLYLEANSKRIIPFSYTLPPSVTGKKNIVVTAYLTDGTVVAQGNSPLLIRGAITKFPVTLQNPSIEIDGQQFGFQEAPIVSASSTASFLFTIPRSTTTGSVSAKIQLFNRADIESNFIKELEPVSFSVNATKDTQVTIPLPTDMNPLVYAGKIVFSSEVFEIPPLVFRYVIDGPIATIRNINSDKLTIKKNKKFNVEVIYAGQPVAPGAPAEDVLQSATLKVRAINEKGEEVAYSETSIDLLNQTSVQIPLTAQVSAEKIAFTAHIITQDGTILSSFSTDLPSEEQLKQWYKKDFWNTYRYAISFAFLSILLIGLIAFLKKKKIKGLKIEQLIVGLLIVSVLFFANEIIAQVSTGYQIESGSVSTRGAELNAIFSPLPPSVRSYSPGEYFDIAGDARFGATLSTSALISVFVPRLGPFQSPSTPLTNPLNWTQSNLDYYAAWWKLQPPSNLFNLPIPAFPVSPYLSSTLYGWMNNNYISKSGTWAVNASGNNVGGNYVSFDNLSGSVANELLDLRKIVYPTNSARVFADGVSLGYMVDSNTFERELQIFFRTNGLGSVYSTCLLREGVWVNGACLSGDSFTGSVMKDLYPPTLIGGGSYLNPISFNGTMLRYPVLISKYRSYEALSQSQKDTGAGQSPFTFEQSNGLTIPNSTELRNLYKNEIEFLLITAQFMEDYQLTGWQNIANFDFGGTLSSPSFNIDTISKYDPYNYSVTYNESRIDEIVAGGYNSVEFNMALKALFDFTFYYNEKFFIYSKQHSSASQAAGQTPSMYVNSIINMYTSFHSRTTISGFDPAPTYSYWVPPIPGIKKAYLYLYLNNNSSTYNLSDKELLISQSICIRGTGACPDETSNLACPNLMDAVYTMDSETGFIYRDGVLTTLIEDGSGNCVESFGMCNTDYTEGETTYTYDGQGPYGIEMCTETVWTCGTNPFDGMPEWQGESASINCYDPEIPSPTVSCQANPISVDVGVGTIFEAMGEGGVVAYPENYPDNYRWEWSEYSDFSALVDPGNCNLDSCPKSYQTEGSKTMYVRITDDRPFITSDAGMCVVNVGLGQCTESPPSSCIDNQRYVWTCGPETDYQQVSSLSPDTTPCSEPVVGGPEVTMFEFEPNVVSEATESCKLSVEASNVVSCRLYRNGVEDTGISNTLTGLINTQSKTLTTSETIPVSVGTYQIGCTGPISETETVSKTFSSQKCALNPDFKEN